jgi:hypothetical protein
MCSERTLFVLRRVPVYNVYIFRILLILGGRSGIESRWGRDFPPVQTGPGAHPVSCKMGTRSFPGVKCGQGVLLTTHSPPSGSLVMEKYSYSCTHPLDCTEPVTGTLYLYLLLILGDN